ncbi:hypothetical protein COLO4_12645 [Corchorus olitorius]|uniref:Uncharacterized protein n=1 Tax=Corchorus olitorius TaxID=93759 RepID=A0A1R3K062_9ROSI|nr:hypothetical protein COLO4_12645 [Corchorus olitorius]
MGGRRIDEATLENFLTESKASTNKGWLLDLFDVSPDHYCCFLRNLNTSEKIRLPNLPRTKFSYSKHIILTANAPKPSFVFSLVANRATLLFCRLGSRDLRWTPWNYDQKQQDDQNQNQQDDQNQNQNQNQQDKFPLRDAVIYKGKVFVLHGPTDLCEIEIQGRHDQVLYLKRYGDGANLPGSGLFSTYQLIESCGELFAVGRKSIMNIDVFKMDFSQNRWQQVFKLSPGRCFALFRLNAVSFSAAELGVDENTILLREPEIRIVDNYVKYNYKDDDQSLYSFNLDDMSLSVWRSRRGATPWTLHMDQKMIRFQTKPKGKRNKHKGKFREDRTIQGSKGYGSSKWFKLPIDMEILIFECLSSVYDVMNVRAVCKKWRSLVHPIQWSLIDHTDYPFEYPWLMFPHGEIKGMYSFYDPIGNSMHSIRIHELEDCKIRFSIQGWLLVTKAPTSIFFFEPFTRTRNQLPELERYVGWFNAFCVTDAPTSTDWQIVAIGYSYDQPFLIYRLGPGMEQWTSFPIECKEVPRPSFSNLVFDGEYFCYLGKNGKVICFDFFNPEQSFFKGSSSTSFSNYWRQFLVCYQDELMSVWIDQTRDSIDVFKLNRKGDEWVEIKSLDEKILYLSRTTTLAIEAQAPPRIRNTVQLSMLSDNMYRKKKNNGNISYSLRDRRFYVYNDSIGYSSLGDLYDTKEIFLCGTWIQPLMQPYVTWNI